MDCDSCPSSEGWEFLLERMMPDGTRIEAGTKFNLYIHSMHGRVVLSIRIKDGFFDRGTNTAGVYLDKETAQRVVDDMQARIDRKD